MKEILCKWCRAALVLAAMACCLACGPGCVGGPASSGNDQRRIQAVQEFHGDPLQNPQAVVVKVNEVSITQAEMYRRFLRQYGTRRYLEGLVSEEMVAQEARRRGITVTPEEISRRVDELLDDEARQAGGQAELERQYAEFGLTLAESRAERARELEARLTLSKLVKSLRVVNDEVLREFYKATYANTRHAVRHIAYSFRPRPGHTEADLPRLKLEAQNRALRAADRVRKGADFSALARAESEDEVTAARGGDLGALADDPRAPEFLRVVFKLAAGEVSEPVENPNGGYHVFQVTAIISGESFVDCQEKMRREILDAEPNEDEIRAALKKLRAQTEIVFFPAASEEKSPNSEGKVELK